MTPEGGSRTALIAGASGLVGSELVAILLGDPAVGRVHTLVRRPSGIEHAALTEQVIDFDRLPEAPGVPPLDEAFCCLGTTMRAAGSRDAFRRVDHDYVVSIARLAAAAGSRSLAVISSVGADPEARSFYLRVKGETERDLRSLHLPHLAILRPSLLLGDRHEPRVGERIGEAGLRLASPVLVGSLARYRPVQARTVALAMVAASRQARSGTAVLEYPEIMRLASEAQR